jgi:hypothetical protein
VEGEGIMKAVVTVDVGEIALAIAIIVQAIAH